MNFESRVGPKSGEASTQSITMPTSTPFTMDLHCDNPACTKQEERDDGNPTFCNKDGVTTALLRPCNCCRAVYYCSEACQIQDADHHQTLCQSIHARAKQDLYNEETVQAFEASIPFTLLEGTKKKNETVTAVELADHPQQHSSSSVCSICLEDVMQNGRMAVTLHKTCHHSFCVECIVKWQRHTRECQKNQANFETPPMPPDETSLVQADVSITSNNSMGSEAAEGTAAVNGNGDVADNLQAPSTSEANNVETELARLAPFTGFQSDPQVSSTCPCCRRQTHDLEGSLLEMVKYCSMFSKQLGCPSQRKEQLLNGALQATECLFKIDDSNPRAFLGQAEILIRLERYSEALAAIKEFMSIDRAGHETIRNHPVLAWMEYAREAHDALDYPRVANALKMVWQLAAQVGWPTYPPVVLRGAERIRYYQTAFCLQGEAYMKMEEWQKAMDSYRRLLNDHFERRGSNRLAPDEDSILIEIWKNLALCALKLNAFAAAIDAVDRAIAIDRTVAGLHKTRALACVGLAESRSFAGEKEIARAHRVEVLRNAVYMMQRGLHYEAPWDDANRASNEELYKDFLSRLQEPHLGVDQNPEVYS